MPNLSEVWERNEFLNKCNCLSSPRRNPWNSHHLHNKTSTTLSKSVWGGSMVRRTVYHGKSLRATTGMLMTIEEQQLRNHHSFL